MSEGEVPEIPQHLQEGLPSAGVLEETARREYQIQEMAWEYRIPQESLKNGTVHRYVSVLRDLDAAMRRDEDSKQGGLDISAVIPEQGSARERRLTQVRGLYRLAERLLLDGLGSRQIDEAQFAHTLDGVLRDFGGKAEWDGARPDRAPAPAEPGLWHGNKTEADYPATGRASLDAEKYPAWWVVPDATIERDDQEHRAALSGEAQRQGLAPDVFDKDPLARSTLTRLVYGRQLVQETTELAGLPPAPGLMPSAVERLAAVAPLTKLAVSVLQEEFKPGQLSPTEATGQLQAVVRPLGLKVA